MNTKKLTIHSIFLNQSDQHYLKDFLRVEINRCENLQDWYQLQIAELWPKCDPVHGGVRSKIIFNTMNSYKDNIRIITHDLKYLRRIQKQVKGSTRDTFDIMDTEE